MIQNLTTKDFDKFIAESQIPVLIDYWADWCGPCKMMLPILEDLSTEFEEQIIIAKVNVDENPELTGGMKSIPTMRIYKSGTLVKEIVGAKPKPALLKDLEEFINA